MSSNIESNIDFLHEYANYIDMQIANFMRNKEYPNSVYQPIKDFLALGGKRFRPALTMISAEMFGLRKDEVLKPALAIELFHNFTLIHDDIEDNSELRRGKPCIHKTYGIPIAINAGDGLFILVWDLLTDLQYGFEINREVQRFLLKTFKEVLEGQGVELDWITNNKWEIKEDDYYKMVYGKTGSLISGSLAVSGIIAKATNESINDLAEFGKLIGIAFQIQDDYLNLFGEVEKYKKEIGGDISEGKRTLMTIHALQNLNKKDSLELKDILSQKTKDVKKISRAIELIKKSNSHMYAKNRADELISKAINIAEERFPNNVYKERLLTLAKYLVKREH
ncbi:MAG: polyprenyl synthetase family protein [Candidatus Anstonellales archaeon]